MSIISVVLLPSHVYNMHQDTKSARLIVVCKRTLTRQGRVFRKKTLLIPCFSK